jgi:hypothetical protein
MADCSRMACRVSFLTSGGSVGLMTMRGELSGSTDSWRRTETSMLVMVSGVILVESGSSRHIIQESSTL